MTSAVRGDGGNGGSGGTVPSFDVVVVVVVVVVVLFATRVALIIAAVDVPAAPLTSTTAALRGDIDGGSGGG